MSRLMHLTALLLSLLVPGQSVASIAEGWICNATGTPMVGCPCTAPHGEDGSHPDSHGFASSACCERIQSASETPAPVAIWNPSQVSFEKVLLPMPLPPAAGAPPLVERPSLLAKQVAPSGPPLYLQLRHLLI